MLDTAVGGKIDSAGRSGLVKRIAQVGCGKPLALLAARGRSRPLAWMLALAGTAWCVDAACVAHADPLELQEVAEGIHVYTGPHEDAGTANLGSVGNLAVVIGGRSVAVIDSGGSRRFGDWLHAAIKVLTPLPVSHVVNTHAHPDHVFGNAAFEEADPVIVGHRRLQAALATRGQHYFDAYARRIGDLFAGTRVVPPTLEVSDTLQIDLGDRMLEITAFNTAHTDADVTVFDPQTSTLIAGDLVSVGRLPVVDGSLKGWLEAMDRLREVPAKRVVPGHGPPSVAWPDALGPQERYLRALLRDIRIELAAGGTIENAIRWVAASESGNWARFEEDHPRNVTASFTELEWE